VVRRDQCVDRRQALHKFLSAQLHRQEAAELYECVLTL
jgi:hypothetical protein